MRAVCVCATLGRLKYLPRVLAMFLTQTHKDAHLVIYNEVIPDVTCPIICEQSLSNVTIINALVPIWQDRKPTHRKAYLAVKRMVYSMPDPHEAAFVLWDDDDVHLPQRVESLLSGMANNLDAWVVRHDSYIHLGNKGTVRYDRPHPADRAVDLRAYMTRLGILQYDKHSGYDQHMLKAARDRSVVIPGCCYGYCFAGINYHLSCSNDDHIRKAAQADMVQHMSEGGFFLLEPDFGAASRLVGEVHQAVINSHLRSHHE